MADNTIQTTFQDEDYIFTDWLEQVAKWSSGHLPLDRFTRVKYTQDKVYHGVNIAAITDQVGSGISPCKLTAKTNDTTYTGDVYGNGTDTTYTEHNVTIRLEGMATGETLPFNVVFHAYKQKWSGTAVWTILDTPRNV